MTKREMYAMIATVNADNAEIVDFCKREIALLDSRKASKSMIKTQKENEGVKEQIIAVLACGDKMTVTEIIAHDGLVGYTNQKVSALLRQLIESGKVVKTIEGKKAYFTLNE